ncbi:ATP-binding cassette domain-containing protein [Anaerosphaera multitolerans]|uniref:ATP-binding cassette domain-containing protein n=1 Tax=Anaerosphaera multitolerans TaxID=2487351 RepID=A0A437S5W4_9FIRM|nr:ATP-binding cassette domain-containing protein [Anaerosphaera multitolerans]RVU54400.1 ATP-binding cassette domain-containing protein [Anaerosphaera multitolerans]
MEIMISDLEMTYSNGKKALQDINLVLESPNLIGLLGPNGAGKTTLIKLLTMSLIQTKGEVFLRGKSIVEQEKILKSQLGYLPQVFGLYEDLTVYQFLEYMSVLKGIKKPRSEILEKINMTNLKTKSKKKIRTLSGGQKQRVGIAQALLGNPSLMIFDEPTVGLDPEERINFRNLFSKIAENKLVILSTHIVEDIQAVCNQLIVMDEGKIIFTGTPEELIYLAQGHVGIFYEHSKAEQHCEITSRVNTANGVICRGVAEILPEFMSEVEPTLEDAYMYLMSRKDRSDGF